MRWNYSPGRFPPTEQRKKIITDVEKSELDRQTSLHILQVNLLPSPVQARRAHIPAKFGAPPTEIENTAVKNRVTFQEIRRPKTSAPKPQTTAPNKSPQYKEKVKYWTCSGWNSSLIWGNVIVKASKKIWEVLKGDKDQLRRLGFGSHKIDLTFCKTLQSKKRFIWMGNPRMNQENKVEPLLLQRTGAAQDFYFLVFPCFLLPCSSPLTLSIAQPPPAKKNNHHWNFPKPSFKEVKE